MATSEVADLLAALGSGQLSLQEVAERFRHRTWPRSRRPASRGYLEMAENAQTDPSANIRDSIDEVTAAYDRGEISREQYRALAHAVADSINAEAQRAGRGSVAGD